MCSRVGVGERLSEDGLIIEELITKKGLMGFKKECCSEWSVIWFEHC
jgi:hypothetical protein